MSLPQALLNKTEQALEKGLSSNLSTGDRHSDLFEAYVWSITVEAAQQEASNVDFEGGGTGSSNEFTFRKGPGKIWSKNFSYAIAEFRNAPDLEIHLDIEVSGRSSVNHECDILVIEHHTAKQYRNRSQDPQYLDPILHIECKLRQNSNITKGAGRAFIGLTREIPHGEGYFVTNDDSRELEALLTSYRISWENRLLPRNKNNVSRLYHSLQRVFVEHKAKSWPP